MTKSTTNNCPECVTFSCGECDNFPACQTLTEPKAKKWKCIRPSEQADGSASECSKESKCFDCSCQLGITSGARERAEQARVPFLVSPYFVAELIASTPKCQRCGVALVRGSIPPAESSPALFRVRPDRPYNAGNVGLGCLACVRKIERAE